MSKALKIVVGVVASIAIPFVAPYVANALGMSAAISGALGATAGAITATGATIAGGLTGAALGAANAALTGGKIGKGALFGALGGGLGGYNNPTAGIKGAAGAAGATAPAVGTLAEPAGSVVQSATGATGGGLSGAAANTATGAATSGATTGALAAAGGAMTGAAGAAPAATSGTQTFLSGLKSAAGEVFSPKNVMQAGLQLGSSALAGSGMSGAERRAFAAQEAEARRVADMGRATDQMRFDEATKMLNDARYFDPEYMGLQSARKEQQRGAIGKAEALRGMSGSERVAESRRRDLGTSRNVGTAYDVGYGAGVEGRLKTRSAGLANLPVANGLDALGKLQNAYGVADERRTKRIEEIGTLFGGFTGRKKAEAKG